MDATPKNEIKLINDITEGKKAAFHQLYDLMSSPLYSFGKKYLSDNILLEDFVQESFISFWNKRSDFDKLSTIKSYLYTSVKNSCLNYLKHQNVLKKNEDSLILKLETDHYYDSAVIEEETFNLLYSEIKNLPESSQQVMLLAFNGLKNPEIAEELGISVNTVKTLKKNAYSKLRDKLSLVMQSFLASILL